MVWMYFFGLRCQQKAVGEQWSSRAILKLRVSPLRSEKLRAEVSHLMLSSTYPTHKDIHGLSLVLEYYLNPLEAR